MIGRRRAEPAYAFAATRTIDTEAALEAVIEATAVLRAPAGHSPYGPSGTLAETALASALPGRLQPPAARSALAHVRRDPRSAAGAYGCTLGAVLVWRAVDRAERAGRPCLAAAEAGLLAALAYLELLPPRQLEEAGVGAADRRALIADLERHARRALTDIEAGPVAWGRHRVANDRHR